MTSTEDASGRAERALARALVSALPESTGPALRLGRVDLRPSAEHLLYTALRQPAPPAPPAALVRALGRIGRAIGRPREPRGNGHRLRAAVFVTRSVHLTLYDPVKRILSDAGIESIVVDAETRASRARIGGAHLRLADIRPRDAARLAAHATTVHARLRRAPASWRERVGESDAAHLLEVLRRGLPLVAIDVARVDAVLERARPSVAVCFSESGLLARTVPAAAALRAVPALDLPHAEAADPWGVAGAGYDGFAVYGPRSRRALETGGIPADRIAEIGPLRYDALLARAPIPAQETPRCVVFASQPSDPRKPATHPDVKRAALFAARSAAAALAPAELVIVPHPIEPEDEPQRFVSQLPADGPPVRVEREAGLHDVLAGAWLLVTASSQSVFDAVLSGVPAMTVNPTDSADPVTFAAEGIAIGVRDEAEAAAAAAAVLSPTLRAEAVARGRAALGNRIGPLDGRAAERAAAWVASFATAGAGAGTTPAHG